MQRTGAARADLDMASMMYDTDVAARRRAWRKWAGPEGEWATRRAQTGRRDASATINYFAADSPRDFSTAGAGDTVYTGLVELHFLPGEDNLLVSAHASPHELVNFPLEFLRDCL